MRKFQHLGSVSSSLSLLCYFLIIFLSFNLVKILPPELQDVMTVTYFCNFAGTIIGIIICSLIMPLPNKDRPPAGGIIFIAVITAAQFSIRSFGIKAWIDSMPLRVCLAVLFGMFSAITYGLFFLYWLRQTGSPRSFAGNSARTGKYCPLIIAASLVCGTAANIHSFKMLEAAEPITAAAVLFNAVKWILPVFGAASIFTLLLMKKARADINEAKSAKRQISPDNSPEISDRKFISAGNSGKLLPEPQTITNSPLILRLLGLVCVFTILNGIMEMRLFPLVADSSFFRPNYIVRSLIIIILCFLAGQKINTFISIYLVPAIGIFIMMSCLPLLGDYSLFVVILSTLVTSYHHSSWAVFSTAVVENYYGDKHFYGVAVSVHFCSIFSFFSSLFSGSLRGSPEFTVLYSAAAATVFVLLSFKVIFPALFIGRAAAETHIAVESSRNLNGEGSRVDNFLEKYNLSKREIEVAKLMICEGMDTEEIAERLFISLPTVKTHITNIYKKFNVKKRAEFMAMFVRLYT